MTAVSLGAWAALQTLAPLSWKVGTEWLSAVAELPGDDLSQADRMEMPVPRPSLRAARAVMDFVPPTVPHPLVPAGSQASSGIPEFRADTPRQRHIAGAALRKCTLAGSAPAALTIRPTHPVRAGRAMNVMSAAGRRVDRRVGTRLRDRSGRRGGFRLPSGYATQRYCSGNDGGDDKLAHGSCPLSTNAGAPESHSSPTRASHDRELAAPRQHCPPAGRAPGTGIDNEQQRRVDVYGEGRV